jgi:hypothetical protein
MRFCRPVAVFAAALVIWVGGSFEPFFSRQRAVAASVSIDDAKAHVLGIRKLVGEHLVLYTDLPSIPEIDELPAVFDAAVPQWAEYFGIDEVKTRDWKVRAFLIGNRKAFDQLGVMPAGDDSFLHGLASGSEFWLYDQPSAYYRRHLLLHEGTHAFMGKFLGGCGPGWYMEGTAELFGTHRMAAGSREPPRGYPARSEPKGVAPLQLEMRVMPQSREEVPMWGRIKLIRDAVAKERALDLPTVMALDNRKQMDDESYAWCWAAAKLLDSDPRYRDRFRELKKHTSEPDFNNRMQQEYGADWGNVLEAWPAFISALDYGYDVERMSVDFQRGTPLEGKSRSVTISADKGWQSSGVLLEAGKTYHIAASGRYQIAAEKSSDGERTWPCEPGGVTIEYHDGRPLGMLLGAVVEVGRGKAESGGKESVTGFKEGGFAHPFAIGLGTTFSPAASGTLYLRVNDSAAQLDDNRGTLTIRVDD